MLRWSTLVIVSAGSCYCFVMDVDPVSMLTSPFTGVILPAFFFLLCFSSTNAACFLLTPGTSAGHFPFRGLFCVRIGHWSPDLQGLSCRGISPATGDAISHRVGWLVWKCVVLKPKQWKMT